MRFIWDLLKKWFTLDREDRDKYFYRAHVIELVPFNVTPLAVLELVRQLMKTLTCSQTEVELIILVASRDEPVTFGFLADQICHVSDAHLARQVRRLVKVGHLEETNGGICGEAYTVSPLTMSSIRLTDI